MLTIAKPPCIKCGSLEVEVVSSHFYYDLSDHFRTRLPTETVYSFRCQCGCAFTHTVKTNSETDLAERETAK